MTVSDRTPIPCTAVVAIRSGDVLLLRRSASVSHFPRHWCFPGGKDDLGETAEACAVRELRQETGLVVAEEDLERIGRTEMAAEDGRVYAAVVFRATTVAGWPDAKHRIVLDGEHDQWGTFRPDHTPSPLHPGAAEVLGWLVRDDQREEVR